MFTRRQFVGVLSAVAALPGSLRALGRRLALGGARQRAIPSQAAIRALGAAILPSEMGQARLEIASDAFWRWMNGYREGAELLHPYGSPKIGYAAPSPVPNWATQLNALDRAARGKHQKTFAALDVNERQALVRDALSDFKGERLPNVVSAPHVALGLLAHFYDSSDATDLCYRARIGRNKCRPLAHNGRKPLPLAEARASTGPA
ncbi:MAG TPA: hypothetical protein VH762_18840 [Gemmatimonadaceae bacterium]